MKFDIYNLTDETITASSSRAESAAFVYLQPQKPTRAPGGAWKRLYLTKTPAATDATANAQEKESAGTFEIPLPGSWSKRKGSWNEVSLAETTPWRVYCYWSAQALVVLPRRNVSSFLADMPDSLPLSSLLLPGTHETMAFYGWPVSQCQEPNDTLSAQLLAGIRVLDVRLAVVPVTAKYLPFNFKSKSTPAPVPNPTSTDPPGAVTATTTSAEPELRLLAYHGIYPQRTPFTTILSTIHTFLNSPAGQSETIVMSLKQEDFQVTSKDVWARLVREEIMASPGGFKNTGPDGKRDMGMWYLENRIPTLGEVRGKVVMFSRFNGDKQNWEGGTQGMGIHPTRWPNSDRNGFVWKLKGTTVRTHDWYAIPSFLSVPEKVTLSTSVLHPTISVPLTFPLPEPGNVYDDTEPQLSITYLSAATFPLALPPFVAKGIGFPGWKLGFEGVNSRTAKWLLEELVPALRSTPAAQLHDQAVANADVNTATRDGPVDPDTLRRRRLRWWRKEKKVVDDRGAAARGAQASASGVANAGGVDGADQTHASDTQVIPSTTMESRRLRGWVMLDYYTSDSGLVPLLIECNYRARKSGQEGWP